MTSFSKATAAASPSRRSYPLFAAKDQRVPGEAARAARIDRLLGGTEPDVRIPHRAEVFLRVCAADGVMIWNGAARFDEGAGAFFALKPEDEARFFAARAARFQEGLRPAPPALDWDDDGADNGMAAPSAAWDAETEKRHRRLEALRREGESLERPHPMAGEADDRPLTELEKEARAAHFEASRRSFARDIAHVRGAAPAETNDGGFDIPADIDAAVRRFREEKTILRDARETCASQDEGKARWFGPAGDDGPAECLTDGERALALANMMARDMTALRWDLIALREELRTFARIAPVEEGAFMRELPIAPPPRRFFDELTAREKFFVGALFGASAAAMIFVLITYGGGS